MNVLMLASWYPTETNQNSGVFIKEHAHSIKLAGINVVVLALVIHRGKQLFKIQTTDKFDENGVRTVIVEIFSSFRDIIYHFIPIQYHYISMVYRKLIEPEFRPDIIHSNVILPAGILGDWLAHKLKKPHVITEHWSRIEGLLKKPILSFWAKNAYINAAKIIPVSNYLQKKINNLIPAIKKSKFSVVGNVVNSSIFYYKEQPNQETELQFCAIATWVTKKLPDKLPELFIEALSKIQINDNRHFKLIMIGGGDRLDELKTLCKKIT